MKEKVLGVGKNIDVRPRKKYVGFVASTNFVDVHPHKSQLKLWINLSKENWMIPKTLLVTYLTLGIGATVTMKF